MSYSLPTIVDAIIKKYNGINILTSLKTFINNHTDKLDITSQKIISHSHFIQYIVDNFFTNEVNSEIFSKFI